MKGSSMTRNQTVARARGCLLAALILAGCAGGKPAVKSAPPAAAQATGTQTPAGQAGAGQGAAPATGEPAAEAPETVTPDAEFRQSKPEPLASQAAFEAPVPVQLKLKNGARLLVVENHNVPLVAVSVLIEAGNDADPLPKAGLADFVASMLDEGTKTRTAPQLAEAIENLAAHLGASAGPEYTRVSLNSLKETLPQALDVLADVLVNPAFRPGDLERVRGLLLTDLLQKSANPGAVARDQMDLLLYGPKHPWGQPSGGTPETIKSISQADLIKFHATWYRPNNAIVAVAGDITPAAAKRLLDERLATWKAKAVPKLELPALPQLKARDITLIDKRGTQSQVWVAGPLFAARSPDAVAMRVANNILGGLFGSRLNLNLRENKGYSYGVRSQVDLMKDSGFLLAAGGIVAKHTAEALVEYEKELRTFADGEVSDEELAKAKEALARSLPSTLETDDAIASAVATANFNGEPLDYYKTLSARIARVSRADVARVAKKWVKPDRWPAIVVGPKALSEVQLKKLGLGAVEVKDPHVEAGAAAAGSR